MTSGQELSIGDSTVINSIQKKTSIIYETKDTTLFFLTNQLLQKAKSYGTSIVAYLKNDTINRIVTFCTTQEGILSAEYYLDEELLIFAYLTFEYFDEIKANSSVQNFRGIKSWESRYFFKNEQIKYQKHLGIKNNSSIYVASDVLNDKERILNYIKTKMKR